MALQFLHIVDGDSTAGTLRQAGFHKQGNILSWRDALYSGPVPEGVTFRQLSRLRSRFWTNGKRITEFDERNSKLAKYASYEEVVLWFGSDCTLCELSLIQLLSWFQELKKAPARLSWVTRHGGVLKPAQMVHAHAARKVVTSPQLSFAARVWVAFRSPSPASLDRLVNGSMRVVPGLDNAIRWILREYPGTRDGLSRLQRKLFREVKSRRTATVSAIVASVLSTEWVGDLFLFDLLERCAEAEHPLVSIVEPLGPERKRNLNYRSQVSLTDTGRRVLDGKADHVTCNGIDRWIGGVHLSGKRVPWRWDDHRQRIVSAT